MLAQLTARTDVAIQRRACHAELFAQFADLGVAVLHCCLGQPDLSLAQVEASASLSTSGTRGGQPGLGALPDRVSRPSGHRRHAMPSGTLTAPADPPAYRMPRPDRSAPARRRRRPRHRAAGRAPGCRRSSRPGHIRSAWLLHKRTFERRCGTTRFKTPSVFLIPLQNLRIV
jgi:hypothetical protein